MTKGKTNRALLMMTGLALIATVADLFSVMLADNCDPILSYLLHFFYLFCNTLIPFAFCAYILFFTDTIHKLRENRVLLILCFLPVVVIVLAFLLNPFNKAIFSIVEGAYTRGPWFLLMHVVSVLYVLFGTAYMCVFHKLFSKHQFIGLILVFPISLIGIIVQLLNTTIRTTMFSYTLGILFITMMISRPEEMVDHITGLRKFSAYAEEMRRNFINNKQFDAILINISNYSIIYSVLGYTGTNVLLRQLADELNRMNRTNKLRADLYYLENGRFVVAVERYENAKLATAASWINESLKSTFSVNHMNFSLVGYVCTVKCPEDIGDFQTLNLFGEDLDRHNSYSGDVLCAADLLIKNRFDIMQELDSIIEHALANGQLMVYYQPIYSIKEKKYRSAEALLRLKNEKYGFISPELFIPAAEKSGAIYAIGNFVLDEVCRFIASDDFQKLGLEYIEVNLSVAQCMQTGLAKDVLKILDKYHLSPDKINLEITETAVSYSQHVLDENLRLLAESGISFSLDDYGTGYSNIRRVASLPLKLIKLDKSFTALDENPKMMIVLENTIRMIKEMDLEIVVEGVGTPELADRFSDLNCDYIQGFYYSKPIPEAEFVRFIGESLNA
ncbi:MAG: EAL domain-containing protein [Bacteroides sp.]|nr:EAL domain-containing protein [Eubacterium sp.]MCM1418314.1 EAL domain-containing protein [Roseburia sp.]MCM1462417.1 EAL domain-containing protein [Bacteroides sp.]